MHMPAAPDRRFNPAALAGLIIATSAALSLAAPEPAAEGRLVPFAGQLEGEAAAPEADWCLWYRQPATDWNSALPVGNGTLGAMVFGGIDHERIQFNEHTVWTGRPRSYARPDAVRHLPELRRLLQEMRKIERQALAADPALRGAGAREAMKQARGLQSQAEALAMESFMGDPLRQMAYQPCGDLWLEFPAAPVVHDYHRRLDLDAAVAVTEFTVNGVRMRREVFASHPDQVLDPQLAALLFQYGRYLLIGQQPPRRPARQPAGHLERLLKPPWDSKYTCNINTEMNYWPAEATNLAECQEPLFDALDDLAVSGASHRPRPLRRPRLGAAPQLRPLARHRPDQPRQPRHLAHRRRLALPAPLGALPVHRRPRLPARDRAYPLMKGAAEFFADYLVEDPQTGNGSSAAQQLARAGRAGDGPHDGPPDHPQPLRRRHRAPPKSSTPTADSARSLADLRPRIAPNQIGRHGQLQEWLEDKDDPKKHAPPRLAPVWGSIPARHHCGYGTPDLFAGRAAVAEFRGDEATGWSMGWKINLWARFLDGDHAYLILRQPASAGGAGSRAAGCTRTCSTPIRPSRSTAISAIPPASPRGSRRCCCRATDYIRDPYSGGMLKRFSHYEQIEKGKTTVEFQDGVVTALNEAEDLRRRRELAIVPVPINIGL
jgi:hypothetical protein